MRDDADNGMAAVPDRAGCCGACVDERASQTQRRGNGLVASNGKRPMVSISQCKGLGDGGIFILVTEESYFDESIDFRINWLQILVYFSKNRKI
jgi:hypothetical protein